MRPSFKAGIRPLALLMALVAASAAAADSLPGPAIERMKDIAGRLVLNDRELKEIYRDLHGFALNTPNGADRQLNYIQKLYLTVDRARLQGYYLWRILSVFDYLKAPRQNDFLTLYEKELRRAIEDCRLALRLLDLYSAYLEKKEIQKSVREAAGLIEANVYMYEELVSLIAPHVNAPAVSRRLE